MNEDNINHPTHYTSHPSKVECIQITEHMTFCAGNAVKYLWRAGLKKSVAQGLTVMNEPHVDRRKHIEDLYKAQWYIAREIARLEAL